MFISSILYFDKSPGSRPQNQVTTFIGLAKIEIANDVCTMKVSQKQQLLVMFMLWSCILTRNSKVTSG